MCRLLYIKSKEKFSTSENLKKFAAVAKNSKEYQGHGWGCAYLVDGNWKYYKNVNPIWEDDFSKFEDTTLLSVHARSAFQDKDIFVENNMPFCDENYVFIFNGELRGVKIKADGRIGAEKIFNFIKRFDKGVLKEAVEKGTDIIDKRSEYIKAMNIILCNKEKAVVSSIFNEEEDYFTMCYQKSEDKIVICSDPLDEGEWTNIENRTTTEFAL